jgi:flagellar biosynthesis anti-sigma factor FlgM
MRIDFHYGPQSTQQSEHSNGSNRADHTTVAKNQPSVSDDLAQVSGTRVQVQALAAKVLQLPALRQERIAALRNAIQSGQFRPDAEQTASALLGDMVLSGRPSLNNGK